MTLRLLPALALAALLTACGKPAEAPATPEPVPAAVPAAPAMPAEKPKPPAIALDGEGLRLVAESGSTRLLAFGRPTAETVEVLTGVLGAPATRSTNSECGEGPVEFVEWSNGLTAHFQEGKFTGWSVGREGSDLLTTLNGIGVGSTRAQLTEAFADAKVEETSLGQEFTAGEISGILGGTAPTSKIETMWNGTACVFR